jgi:hypothetical protein
MSQIELTPPQQAVIDAICSGGTVHQAAAGANVLLEDVLAWRRNLPHFRAALEQALSERDLLNREKAMTMADLAYQTLGDILRNDKASPSLKFDAAKFIIDQALGPIPSERKQPRALAKPLPQTAQLPINGTKMHKMQKPGGPAGKPI